MRIAALRQAMAQILQEEGYEILVAADGSQGLKLINETSEPPDLVFLDLKMPKTQGMTVLKNLGKKLLELPVIVMTAYGTSRTTIEAMQLGAYDYLMKPFDLDTLVSLSEKALAHYQAPAYQVGAANNQALTQTDELLGRSPVMAEIFKIVGKVAQGDTTVLILGESGTGKELVAQMIHAASYRHRGTLVKVNCAALPEHLLEAELFGHEKGAFTGADHLRLGRFEQANSGTLFLLVAQSVGISDATVSRIVQGRYLLICHQNQQPKTIGRKNIISLSSLCVPITVGGRTPQQVQQLLIQVVQTESSASPYTDAQIAQLLKINFYIAIARRTVAKYRQIAGIAPAHARRRDIN